MDILFISKNHQFDWKEIIKDAREKDLWADPLEICKILKQFPTALLNTIKWISPVNIEVLIKSISSVHDDIFFGHENSLCP